MATSTSLRQRIAIWIIALTLTIGTILGFFVMILSSEDQQNAQVALQQYQADYTKYQQQLSDQKTKFDGRKSELSNKYSSDFVGQKSRVTKFDAASVEEVKTETIKEGSGETIDDNTAYAAYYIGFNPEGEIFDSSLEDTALKAPLVVQPGQVIEGWSEGLKGKKIGGIYQIKIPSAKAYGETGSGEKIKPNMPLTFIVMPIEKVDTITAPAVTPEVLKAYGQQQQGY